MSIVRFEYERCWEGLRRGPHGWPICCVWWWRVWVSGFLCGAARAELWDEVVDLFFECAVCKVGAEEVVHVSGAGGGEGYDYRATVGDAKDGCVLEGGVGVDGEVAFGEDNPQHTSTPTSNQTRRNKAPNTPIFPFPTPPNKAPYLTKPPPTAQISHSTPNTPHSPTSKSHTNKSSCGESTTPA
jgi:hypothetical protein